MSFLATVQRGGRVLLNKTQKHSPEILLVFGTVSLAAGVYEACKATLKAEDILTEHEEKLEKIEEAKDLSTEEEYSDADVRKDITNTYIKTGVSFAKLYAPAAGLLALSLACFLSSYGIMKKRNISIIAAYDALNEAFNRYRTRVADEFGEEKELEIKSGVKKKKVEEVYTDEKGKEKTRKTEKDIFDTNQISPYAKFFDEYSKEWKKDPEYNLMFLRNQQSYANDLLRSRGHVFLNEVYDMLGLERTKAGQAVGWVMGNGDNFVDFGIYQGEKEKVRDFVNGYERSILLDFNVDGVIWDKI